MPFNIFAGGSNIVFPDKGLDIFLVHIQNGKFQHKDTEIIIDAGVSLSHIIELAIKNGLKGMENLSGIPGSIGGAIVGSSISDSVTSVNVWYKGGNKWLSKNDCKFSYRESIFKHQPFYILQVVLVLAKSDRQKIQKISEEIINVRNQKYKHGLKGPGSFFKNVLITDISPKILSKINQSVIIGGKIPAGFLLTEIGARGMKVGEIEVSDFHGNLIINNAGHGTSKDVKKLAEILKQKVYDKFGIMLEEEVRYL